MQPTRNVTVQRTSGACPIVSRVVVPFFTLTALFVHGASVSAGGTPPTAPIVVAELHGSASVDTSDLRATSAPSWNPARAMPTRQSWEQVVLLPGRILSLPLSGLGFVTRAGLLKIEDSGLVPLAPGVRRAGPPPLMRLYLPGLWDGAGFGAGFEIQSPVAPNLPRLRARYTATVLSYNNTMVGASLGPATLQYEFEWRPQDRFYGIGTSTPPDHRTAFGAQSESARGALRWGAGPDSGRAHPHWKVGVWGGPRSLVTRTGRDSSEPSFEVLFPELGAATLDRRVEHLVYGGSLSTDWRAGVPHWSHGGRLALSVERFDAPVRALALHSSQLDGAQFTRYSVESEVGTSFMRDPRTIRLLVRLTDQSVGSGRDHFLLSDLARLGGRDGLSGFSPARFQDLDLLYARLTYVFPLARLFEFEVHSDVGAVYSDVWSDTKFSTLHHSFGLSLAARGDTAPRAALGFDVSSEGMRVRYVFGRLE
jgi:hypothetical protein